MISLQEEYWDNFEIQNADIEFLYNYLLEEETPQAIDSLARQLTDNRIELERAAMEARQRAGGEVFLPKSTYDVGASLVFPALGWEQGVVVEKREGSNPDIPPFEVVKVELENGDVREFASNLEEHSLNAPPSTAGDDSWMNPSYVMEHYGEFITDELAVSLEKNDDFVRIAGRWFPRALLVDINVGHLNLAEAVLDMEGGGPAETARLLDVIDMPGDVNEKLAQFSMDYALWKDDRFDEVGPAGQILWFLKRLEPKEVQRTPKYLRYSEIDYDRSLLTTEMVALERELDDELSPIEIFETDLEEVEVHLLYAHWRTGSLPLTAKLNTLFPTAYQAPRIRFILVDGETGKKFPGWVVRDEKYVYGLKDLYEDKGVIPGSKLLIKRGENEGEIIVQANTHRPTREWIRTVLVGADGGIVLAMLKQNVGSTLDDRMAIAVPDPDTLDSVWDKMEKDRTPFERIVVNTLRELTKLNPQSHVHASELYAAVNLVRRTPPAPILALLASRPWFDYVGDMHFRFNDYER
jgi:hypothetical protein